MRVHSGYKNICMQLTINCDLGEGMGDDAAIMPFIQSANIACGFHAGDMETMRSTIADCMQHGVAIGAHPSFYDRENFGRKEFDLPVHELYELMIQQLLLINDMAESLGALLQHVKPHGALYNLAARDIITARCIARAVKDFDSRLTLVGLSGSHAITEAAIMGLSTASEVFADRTYQDDGSLTPRTLPGALITDAEQMLKQVDQIVKERTVTTLNGTIIPLHADTICIHGDGSHALTFAKAIHQSFFTA